jgi:hypothetical protein
MATQTNKTDQKIINSGAMQYLIPFPAGGRLLRVTKEGSGLGASIADDLRRPNDAIPFSLALRSLQVQPAQTRDQVTILAGPLQYVMPVPVEGRLIRVTAEGAVLVASVEDDLGRTQDSIPFTSAFRSLHVEPVLDEDFPFEPYIPGSVCGGRR